MADGVAVGFGVALKVDADGVAGFAEVLHLVGFAHVGEKRVGNGVVRGRHQDVVDHDDQHGERRRRDVDVQAGVMSRASVADGGQGAV